MTEYFAVITTSSSGLSIGDIVQLLDHKTGGPILTYIQPPNNVAYSLGVVIDVEPDRGLPYHDVIGLKCQERRPFPVECITKYNCNENKLKTFKDIILNTIIENSNIGFHISDLSARLKSSLQLSSSFVSK